MNENPHPMASSGDQVANMLKKEGNQKLAGAKEALKQKIMRAVFMQAIEELGQPEAIAQAVLEQTPASHDLIVQASTVLQGQLVEEVAHRSTNAMEDVEDAVAKAREHIGGDHATLIGASSVLRELLLEEVSRRALDTLEDVGVAARQARSRVQDDHVLLEGVVSTLNDLLLQEAARRSVATLEDATGAAEAAHAHVDQEEAILAEAVGQLRSMLLHDIAHRSTESISDAVVAAGDAKINIDEDHSKVLAASEVLHSLLLEDIAHRSVEGISDAVAVASEAKERVDEDHVALLDAIENLREVLIEDIASRSTAQIADADAIAEEARAHIEEEHHALVAAIGEVRGRLIQDIIGRSTAAIEDAEAVAQEAQEHISAEHPNVEASVSALREKLICEIAAMASSSIKNAEGVAEEAREQIDPEHEYLQEGGRVLRELLVSEVAKQSTAALQDSEAVATQAKTHIETDEPTVTEAAAVLRERLIEDIVALSTEALRDAEVAAKEAIGQVDTQHDVLVRARKVLKERMLESMLSEVIREISDVVGNTQNDPYNDFFKEAVAAMSQTAFTGSAPASPSEETAATSGSEPMEAMAEPEASANEAATAPEEIEEEEPQGLVEEDKPVDDPVITEASMDEEIQEQGAADEQEAEVVFSEESLMAEAFAALEEEIDPTAEEPYAEQGEVEPSEAVDAKGLAEADEETTSQVKDEEVSVAEAAFTPQPEEEPAFLAFTEEDFSEPTPEQASMAQEEDSIEEDVPEVIMDANAAEAVATETTALNEAEEQQAWFKLSELEEDADDAELFEDILEDYASQASEEVSEEEHVMAGSNEIEATDEKPWRVNQIQSLTTSQGDGASQLDEPAPMFDEHRDEPTCYYIYGIMSSQALDTFEEIQTAGIDAHYPVSIVQHDELAAVVSKVAEAQFGSEAMQAQMKDTEWLKDKVRAHATVMEHLKPIGTLVPLRFGTITEDEAGVHSLLNTRYAEFLDAFDRLAGKQEWGLRIYRNVETIHSRLAQSANEVEGSLDHLPNGIAGFLREELARMEDFDSQETSELITENCIKRSHDALLIHAENGIFKPILNHVDDTKGELVLNAAYLVTNGFEGQFQAEVERMESEYETVGIHFELTGPWPPYHFVEDGGEDGTMYETSFA